MMNVECYVITIRTPMLLNVFQLSKCIKLDMVEEHVVILGFNFKKLKGFIITIDSITMWPPK